MKKNLETYIEKAQSLRNSEPLHSGEELRGILQEGRRSHHDFKNHNRWSFTMKIIGIIAFAGLSGMAVWWNNFSVEKESVAFKNDVAATEKPTENLVLKNVTVGNFSVRVLKDTVREKTLWTPKEGYVMTAENGTIRGIRYIELTDDELENLGIFKTDAGYEYTTEVLKAGVLARFKRTIDTFETKPDYPEIMKPNEIIPFGKPNKIELVAVTHQYAGDGKYNHGSSINVSDNSENERAITREFATMQDEHEKSRWHPKEDARLMGNPSEKYPLISKLIPVYVYFKRINKATGEERKMADVTFWYRPSLEFIAALPERYRIPLETELKILKGIEQKEITPEDACEIIKGEPTFFDLCRTGSGTISELAVFPNPVEADSKCRFVLGEARKVQITLHTTDGRLLKDISPSGEMKAGEQQIPLNMAGVKGGAYLLAVTSHYGEQAVYRIIVR
jgi:hypothetical protein